MDKLEQKRISSEFKRVDAAKEEMEYRIEDLLNQIERLKANITIQDKRLEELKKEMK